MIDFPPGEMRTRDFPVSRFPSDVRTNAPLRVPTKERTELMLRPSRTATDAGSPRGGCRE